MISITIENENFFCAGWTACHCGLPRDCMDLKLTSDELSLFHDGWDMHAQTVRMEDPADVLWHGHSQIAFLMQTTNQNVVPFVRDRVSISA